MSPAGHGTPYAPPEPHRWNSEIDFRSGFIAVCVVGVLPAILFDVPTHAGGFLFGFGSVLILVFLSLALPRWIGATVVPSGAARILIAVHLAAAVPALAGIPIAIGLGAAATVVFAAIVLVNVLARRAWRSVYPALLVALHAGTSLSAAFAGPAAEVRRAALAAMILLILEIGHRIANALAATVRDQPTLPPDVPASVALGACDRLLVAVALVEWVCGVMDLVLPAAASLVGLLRIGRLVPVAFSAAAGLGAIVGALAWIPMGFCLRALEAAGLAGSGAPVHAWSIGAFGLMAVAVVTSVARKRQRRPFAPSRAASVAYAAMTSAVVLRLAMTIAPDAAGALGLAARIGWLVSLGATVVVLAGGGRAAQFIGRSRQAG